MPTQNKRNALCETSCAQPDLPTMNKILAGIAVNAALLGFPALAADLQTNAPPAIPYPNWSGPYLGISGGARYNAVDGNVTSATVGTPLTPLPFHP
jgi:hypothetical protein